MLTTGGSTSCARTEVSGSCSIERGDVKHREAQTRDDAREANQTLPPKNGKKEAGSGGDRNGNEPDGEGADDQARPYDQPTSKPNPRSTRDPSLVTSSPCGTISHRFTEPIHHILRILQCSHLWHHLHPPQLHNTRTTKLRSAWSPDRREVELDSSARAVQRRSGAASKSVRRCTADLGAWHYSTCLPLPRAARPWPT